MLLKRSIAALALSAPKEDSAAVGKADADAMRPVGEADAMRPVIAHRFAAVVGKANGGGDGFSHDGPTGGADMCTDMMPSAYERTCAPADGMTCVRT